MNKYLAKIGQEWERSLLVGIGLLLMVALAVLGFSFLSEEGGTTSQSQALPAVPDFIDTKAFAFMRPANLGKGVNPMAFRKKLPKAFVTPPSPPKPGDSGVKPPAPPKPGGGPSVVTPPGDTPPKPGTVSKPPPPKPPPRKITVLYRGMYKGLTERELAFISADDSKTKKSAAFYLGEGGRVHGALTVKSFGRDALVLDCGNDREVTVEIGKKKEIVLE
jgi:hypothetical protein